MAQAMDDSFRVRVEKIFGSLTAAPPSSDNQKATSSLQSTLWSLSGDKVERREWRRDDSDPDAAAASRERDEMPCAASFDEMSRDRRRDKKRTNWSKAELEDDLDDLDDEEREEDDDDGRRVGDDCSDEWEIRSSIGLDRTLDNEEEEDEFDKVASGRENAGERLYMKSVNDQGSFLHFHNVIRPNSLSGGAKDPRANHLAAETRLREDEAEAQKLNSDHDRDMEGVKERSEKPPVAGDGQELRSILKRKSGDSDSKSPKRVRFDPACKIVSKEEDVSGGSSAGDVGGEEGEIMSGWDASSRVPDYLRNPSKYTRYSFESSPEVDERANTQAYMEFLKLVQCSKPTKLETGQEDASSGLKTVTFIPKKKPIEAKAATDTSDAEQDVVEDSKQFLHHTGLPVSIAVGEFQDFELDSMEEEGTEASAEDSIAGLPKPGRRYRTKSISDDLDP
ncbi:hypothetical protein Tsubulata_018612 [Turnera subulata]|uniref:Protein TSSC4 n=1 Tax=Turnera subulata TaxID=218843 RepID=A0A9Q0IZ88_9ROSI|nr:hypothetical protein Tsubulata_018612 [Turnera subulata]